MSRPDFTIRDINTIVTAAVMHASCACRDFVGSSVFMEKSCNCSVALDNIHTHTHMRAGREQSRVVHDVNMVMSAVGAVSRSNACASRFVVIM